ncbi:hypothetical protein CKO25_19980 [Thiocapsa imhoffii]|uniref:Fe2OG dioxygenase domain-containing protein n=1 Tax=Thiocapsa imhoffii TaxID=382777 RepID=A0A9X1BBH9_9GAMM|nr:hypothetical protein [Thiocapsa imhoffii]MBK1646863.1 hypothetical protein [Thiocapsa imhoffii]
MADTALLSLLSKPIIGKHYRDPAYLDQLRCIFSEYGYVKLTEFFIKPVYESLVAEIGAIQRKKRKRDFQMPGYATPRIMSVVSGSEILESSVLLVTLYGHCELRKTLATIIDHDIFGVHHREELMVVNLLEKRGDTHGWHLDDPRYAFIAVLKATPNDQGGSVEYISNWRSLCAEHGLGAEQNVDKGVELAASRGMIRQAHHKAGDCYLLNAGECLHRVTPLAVDKSERWVLNMAFDDRMSIPFGATADLLYGEHP